MSLDEHLATGWGPRFWVSHAVVDKGAGDAAAEAQLLAALVERVLRLEPAAEAVAFKAAPVLEVFQFRDPHPKTPPESAQHKGCIPFDMAVAETTHNLFLLEGTWAVAGEAVWVRRAAAAAAATAAGAVVVVGAAVAAAAPPPWRWPRATGTRTTTTTSSVLETGRA